MAPVTILAASVLIFSSFSLLYKGQLSKIMLTYSNVGLMKEKYIVCRVLRSRSNLRFLSILRFLVAFDVIKSICSSQWQAMLKTNPRCFWLDTSFIGVLLKYTVGWLILCCFREINKVSVFCGLKFTSQFLDQTCTLSRSLFKFSAATFGSSIMV